MRVRVSETDRERAKRTRKIKRREKNESGDTRRERREKKRKKRARLCVMQPRHRGETQNTTTYLASKQ